MAGDETPRDLTAWLSPDPDGPRPAGQVLRRMAGFALMAIGALWMLLCGACTATFIWGGLQAMAKPLRPGDVIGWLEITLAVGGIGISFGIGLCVLGAVIAGRRRKS